MALKNLQNYRPNKNFFLLAGLTIVALLVEGYHPGVEDDAVYLSAIRYRLNPSLYPHDSRWFTLQMQASIFDRFMAAWVRFTHMPIAVSELFWQVLAALFLLWGCRALARRCFSSAAGQWAGVALVGVLFTLPVAGTALYIFDQYLHPRAIATALILAAIVAVLDRRIVVAAVLLVASVVVHPLMGAYGLSYCTILWIAAWIRRRAPQPARVPASAMGLMALPAWIFQGPSPAWRLALSTRRYYFLGRWTWYEWLGAIAPIFILWVMARWARRGGRPDMSLLADCAAIFAVFQLAVACIVLFTPALARLTPMQPMRYLHLVYIMMALLGGGLIGEKLLRAHIWRWALLFVPLALGMFRAQRSLFPGVEHLELPGVVSNNPWLEAFVWVRHNTPNSAYFALDPYYMQLPDEGYHSFRALAERSELADAVKDAAVATQVPSLAPEWQRQTEAVAGWDHFQKANFLRLQQQFGVDWIVVRGSGVTGLDCPYRNQVVAVCRV